MIDKILINTKNVFDMNINESLVLVLGYFDGIHLGHQELINAAKDIATAENLKVGVLSFNQSPHNFYNKNCSDEIIMTENDKLDKLSSLGVDYLFEVELDDEFRKVTGSEFLDKYIGKLAPKHIVAGFDYSFGDPKIYDTGKLKALSKVPVTIVGQVQFGNKKVSSSMIRNLVKEKGDVTMAETLLNGPVKLKGIVVHGKKIGRTLGFPTANVEPVPENQLIPAIGVYACLIEIDGITYQAMGSIGKNETFGEDNPVTIEINILDFDADIYSKKVIITWKKKIRDQEKFSGKAELIEQLNRDKRTVSEYFD